MSEFKKGDRVKVTYEGTVGYVDSSGALVDVYSGLGKDDIFLGTARPDRVNIEKLADPLPTTPGSVIRSKVTGELYFRARTTWRSEFGEAEDPSASALYDVLFDAGADK